MDETNFIARISNPEGRTLSDKLKNFNNIIKNSSVDYDVIISCFTPKNHFEAVLKLKLLISMQRLPDLIEILKSENTLLCSKLLKNKWFCIKLAQLLDDDDSDFVCQVLPFTSFVIRERILKRLAIYGTKLDFVFDKVFAIYGLHVAKTLLVACSSEKITHILKTFQISIPTNLLKILFEKNRPMFEFYLENKYIDESVVDYIAQKDLNYFLKLRSQHKTYIKNNLGQRSTSKLLKLHRKKIIEDSASFINTLHLRTVVKMLTPTDLEEFVFNCLPSGINEFNARSLKNMEKYLGPLKYYNLLTKLLATKYNKNIFDYHDLVTKEMLVALPQEERQKWLSIKPQSDSLIPLLSFEESYSIIRRKIDLTSDIYQRGVWLQALVEACGNDLEALKKTLKYCLQRHKNDDNHVIRELLCQILDQFCLTRLDAAHWDSIEVFLKIINDDRLNFQFYTEKMASLLDQSKLGNEELMQYLHVVISYLHSDRFTDKKKLRQFILLKLMNDDSISLPLKDEPTHIKDFKIITMIVSWNKEFPKEAIMWQNSSRLWNSFKQCVALETNEDSSTNQFYNLREVLKFVICVENNDKEIVSDYFKLDGDLSIDFWLLKHQPETINLYFEKFLNRIVTSWTLSLELLQFIKVYTDENFKNLVLKHCFTDLNQRNAFKIIAALDGEKFLESVSNDTSMESFKLCDSFQTIPALIKYRNNDLKHAIEALYYCCNHIPELYLAINLKLISGEAVSLRKHAIFLSCALSPTSDVLNILELFKTDENISICKHLLASTVKYFVKNPQDTVWVFVDSFLTKLDKDDDETCTLLINYLEKIPGRYQCKFFLKLWELLDLKKYGKKMLSTTEHVLIDLDSVFILKVMLENFLKLGSPFQDEINQFLVQYLNVNPHPDIVFRKMQDILKSSLNGNVNFESLEEEQDSRHMIRGFVETLIDFGSIRVIETFYETCYSSRTEVATIAEYLKLNFYLLKKHEKDTTKFSTNIRDLLKSLVEIYGELVVDFFAKELKPHCEDCLYELCDIFLRLDDRILKLLVLKILPFNEPLDMVGKESFHKILRILRNQLEKDLQLLVDIYIMDLKTF